MQARIQQFQHLIAKLPDRQVSFTLLLLIVVYVAYLSAQSFWLIWPAAEPTKAVMSVQSGNGKQNAGGDNRAILDINLFGEVSGEQSTVEKQPKVIDNAPETSLNIALTGVVAVNKDDKAGLAVIESQGAQETYAVGDSVNGTRAVVQQIFADRVILKVSSRFETLMLDGIDFSKTVTGQAKNNNLKPRKPSRRSSKLIKATEDASVKRELKNTRAELVKDPGKLFDYIRVSPARVNGELVGYKLRPGKNPALFKKMGLQNNELATSINGYALTDMKQAMSAMNELRTAKSATISIDRKGEQLDVLFSLD